MIYFLISIFSFSLIGINENSKIKNNLIIEKVSQSDTSGFHSEANQYFFKNHPEIEKINFYVYNQMGSLLRLEKKSKPLNKELSNLKTFDLSFKGDSIVFKKIYSDFDFLLNRKEISEKMKKNHIEITYFSDGRIKILELKNMRDDPENIMGELPSMKFNLDSVKSLISNNLKSLNVTESEYIYYFFVSKNGNIVDNSMMFGSKSEASEIIEKHLFNSNNLWNPARYYGHGILFDNYLMRVYCKTNKNRNIEIQILNNYDSISGL